MWAILPTHCFHCLCQCSLLPLIKCSRTSGYSRNSKPVLCQCAEALPPLSMPTQSLMPSQAPVHSGLQCLKPMQLLHVLLSATVLLYWWLELPCFLPLYIEGNKLGKFVVCIGCMDAGNHEYDYRTGKEKHNSHNKDPSGAGSPYEPDWGNYGTASSHTAIMHMHCNRNPCGPAEACYSKLHGSMPITCPKESDIAHGLKEKVRSVFTIYFVTGNCRCQPHSFCKNICCVMPFGRRNSGKHSSQAKNEGQVTCHRMLYHSIYSILTT